MNILIDSSSRRKIIIINIMFIKKTFFIDFLAQINYIDLGLNKNMLSFIKEFYEFLKIRKKYWLLPIIIVLAFFGILIVLSQGSAVAPFIYTIF